MGLFDTSGSSGGDVFEIGYPEPDTSGDSPAAGGTLPGSNGPIDGWLDRIAQLGGTVVSAYGNYTKLQAAKASVDASKAASEAANERARIQAQTQRDLLGFQGQAERVRAARDALAAQQDYQFASIFGSPIVVIAIGALLFFVFKGK